MTTTVATDSRQRRWMYVVIAVLVVALSVAAVLVHRSARSTAAAEQKAAALTTALQSAGLRAPAQAQIVRVLGEDGGAVCANPNSALTRAGLLAQLANGAAGPGSRPTLTDSRLLRGEALVLRVYCPEQLPGFEKFVAGLKSAGVAGG